MHITVTGLVQGIGYRPFVAELAERLELAGEVKNVGGIVKILVSGEDEALEQFVQRLRSSAPEGAQVESVQVEEVQAGGARQEKEQSVREDAAAGRRKRFFIAESGEGQDTVRLLPPDLPVCAKCERELKDSANRRYRYPFISCVSCGPRFSIMGRVPYDRDGITMNKFPMCEACENEYRKKGNRRRHAQTIACHGCGPQLRAVGCGQSDKLHILAEKEDALQLAIDTLQQGGILALKDIGGFHFACMPGNAKALRRLREFKNREQKPFAVMFAGVEQVREYCQVNEQEEMLLISNPRPIVLLEKRKNIKGSMQRAIHVPDGKTTRWSGNLAPEVCGDSDRIGALLPCNPLQILLLQALGPLVMTSGNRGGEPIIIRDKDMEEMLSLGCPDLLLTHDREILTPLEDSIYQVTGVGVSILRRGRGCVPEPVWLSRQLKEDCFAAGGDLKAVFALGKGNAAYLGSHFGDLEDYRCLEARRASARHMAGLLQVAPTCMAADLHPGYHSTADMLFGPLPFVKIQHHHAHILSVMAEHGLEGPVLGVAFDGTGYGSDGSIWGGEFLLCRESRMERVGGLFPVTMVGGDAAAKDGTVSLWCYLLCAVQRGFLRSEELKRAKGLPCFAGKAKQCDTIEAAGRAGINTYGCSSAGRLFDAVSTLLGICDYNHYEGQCAILLEKEAQKMRERNGQRRSDQGEQNQEVQIAAVASTQNLPAPKIKNSDDICRVDGVELVAGLFRAVENGDGKAELALAFHRWLVEAVKQMCLLVQTEHGISDIALSGGTFCNRILLEETEAGLMDCGFRVYRNEKVPCGDGGLALGQLYAMTFEE